MNASHIKLYTNARHSTHGAFGRYKLAIGRPADSYISLCLSSELVDVSAPIVCKVSVSQACIIASSQ